MSAITAKIDPTKPMPRLKGFMVIGDLKPGQAAEVRKMVSERATGSWQQMDALLKPLTIHFARWVLINNDTQLLYAAVFDTDFDTYVEDARQIFLNSGIPNFFRSWRGFRKTGRQMQPHFTSSSERSTPTVFMSSPAIQA